MFGIEINNVSMKESICYIEQLIIEKNNSYIVTPNVDHIVKLQIDRLFKEIYDNASLVLADGVPLIWASKLLGKPLKERVSGADLFPELCEYASKKGYSVFFLGAAEGVAYKAAQILKNKFPGLKIVGTYSPPMGFEKNYEENEKILSMIRDSNPHILFVALGAPKQEIWMYHYRNLTKVPVSIGVGASFDFVAGRIKRAPQFIQKIGLEWFWRFCQEPRRLFKRYFIDDMKFFFLLLCELRKLNSKD
ncbi:WecB/TagA/CpsF family glycosyltransferase [Desulforamulus ruminis]|uniref:WecB/TagA/CpsF family glycosyltransferase n=1 Tax=Desulforamulus ruminis TaxID=1564 RepID=UPI002352B198|nr:WecB/TagA/CpsF family glycosyltransferase [Desulforamulus ruminis]